MISFFSKTWWGFCIIVLQKETLETTLNKPVATWKSKLIIKCISTHIVNEPICNGFLDFSRYFIPFVPKSARFRKL